MRTYQMNIREAAIQELRQRRLRLVQALASAEVTGAPRNKIGSTIFPMVRQPSNSNRGAKGHVHCFKAGGHVPHESDVERKFYQLMEWDYTVDTFVVQPFKVPFKRSNGKVTHYTPDCFAISSQLFSGRGPKYAPTAFEIKTREELDEEWPELKPKLRAARSFLAESGFRFRVLTEDRIHPRFLENVVFLLGYRGPRFMLRTKKEEEIVERLMWSVKRSNDDFTPRELLARVSDVAAREDIIPWMWNLYADYVFQCDLLVPLTLDTISWRVGDAGANMLNFGTADYRADWRQPENDWRR